MGQKQINIAFIENKHDVVNPNAIFNDLNQYLRENEIAGITGSFPNSEEIDSSFKPEVILMDIDQTGVHVFKVLSLRKQFPDAGILLFSERLDPIDIFQFISTRVEGYVFKGTNFLEIAKAITDIYSGGVYLSAPIAMIVAKHIQCSAKGAANRLSGPEMHVMMSVAEGLSPKMIAKKLGRSISTIRYYMKSIHIKLNVSSNTQAILKIFHSDYNNFVSGQPGNLPLPDNSGHFRTDS